MQNQDYDYFLKNMEGIYQKYGHKFVAIKDLHILGAYSTFNDALNETLKKEELGTFLIQECFRNKEECVHNFQGNVMPSPAWGNGLGGKTSGHGLSFTSRCNNLARVLPTEVLVESAVKTNTQIKIKAIWDTGASSSLIRPEVATALDLKPVSKELMSTPSDKDVPTNVYLINLYLPNRVKVLEVRVLEGTPNACDMLIGMDVISMGDFAVTNYNGSTMFSFRMPSMTHIDFTKHSHIEPIRNEVQKVGRNDPCPCGSGKKYKQCCGR